MATIASTTSQRRPSGDDATEKTQRSSRPIEHELDDHPRTAAISSGRVRPRRKRGRQRWRRTAPIRRRWRCRAGCSRMGVHAGSPKSPADMRRVRAPSRDACSALCVTRTMATPRPRAVCIARFPPPARSRPGQAGRLARRAGAPEGSADEDAHEAEALHARPWTDAATGPVRHLARPTARCHAASADRHSRCLSERKSARRRRRPTTPCSAAA